MSVVNIREKRVPPLRHRGQPPLGVPRITADRVRGGVGQQVAGRVVSDGDAPNAGQMVVIR